MSITENVAGVELAVQCIDQRLAAIRESLESLNRQSVNKEDVTVALGQFDALWEVLYAQEKVRIANLLVKQVVYDAQTNDMQVSFGLSRI